MIRTDDLNYWPRTVIAVSIVGTVVATLSLLLRLYSRRLTNRRLDVSDLFMNLGLLVSYGVSICGIIGECAPRLVCWAVYSQGLHSCI